jgi:hypothetical protein
MFTRRSRSGAERLSRSPSAPRAYQRDQLLGTLPWQTWPCGSEAGRLPARTTIPRSLGCSPLTNKRPLSHELSRNDLVRRPNLLAPQGTFDHWEWAIGREVAQGFVLGIVGYDYRPLDTIPGPRRSPAPSRGRSTQSARASATRRLLTRRRSFSTCVTIRSSTARMAFRATRRLLLRRCASNQSRNLAGDV